MTSLKRLLPGQKNRRSQGRGKELEMGSHSKERKRTRSFVTVISEVPESA